MESILTSIKKLLGISEEYTEFDPDIIMCINTAITNLTEIGVGPSEGFFIEDETTTWTDFIPESTLQKIEAVKSYIHLNVKLLFDPPISSAHIDSINKQLEKIEWRLNFIMESDS